MYLLIQLYYLQIGYLRTECDLCEADIVLMFKTIITATVYYKILFNNLADSVYVVTYNAVYSGTFV